jgi:hypothetical protein
MVIRATQSYFLSHIDTSSTSVGLSGWNQLDEFVGRVCGQGLDGDTRVVLPLDRQPEVRLEMDSCGYQKTMGHRVGSMGATQWILA